MKFFLLLWVSFALLDLDPDSESEYESTNLIESRQQLFYSKTVLAF